MKTEAPHNMPEVSLVVEIKNKQPVELIDLTKSLVALANQFNNYTGKSPEHLENREGRLFVTEIRSGSIIVELFEFATFGFLPFAENVNTIVGFAGYLKNAYEAVLGRKEEKLPSTHLCTRQLPFLFIH